MDNIMLYINPITHDLEFDEDGMMKEIGDNASSAQAVRETLETWQGEWPLDTGHGVDYERIVNKPNNEYDQFEVEEVIREAIFQEETVSYIDELLVTRDKRTINIAFKGTLSNGQSISSEVTKR